MIFILRAALAYKRAGLSVIAVKDNKESLHRWRRYQSVIMHDKVLYKVFTHPSTKGIAIACGPVSGQLEIIDLDAKHDIKGTLYKDYLYKLNNVDPSLVARLGVAHTKNLGFHFFYRCPEIDKSTVLAKRNCTQEELLTDPNQKAKVLIETRGTGGYVIVFPTDGYKFLQHNLFRVPIIKPTERQTLFSIARSFDETGFRATESLYPKPTVVDPYSPFDDYNARGDIIGLLESHGWVVIRTIGLKTFFRRPGHTDHDTSGDFHHGLRLFAVFTTSTQFQAGKGYRPYAVYAILECDSDFKLAAKRLLLAGYGISYNKRW